ncbi:terminase large subunit [uncultured Mediterranean phage uvMED]|nr:terminase large subunit [uncultured Mediterranean phage uvMED]
MPLSKPQKQILECDKRFRVLITGRRFGKTFLCVQEIAKFARYPKKKVWYVAPTYRMAKDIVWNDLVDRMTKHKWVSKINHSDLKVILRNGSEISLRGADNENSLRGVGLDFLVMDEFADIKEHAYTEVLRPTLSDKGRMGAALFCGTPRGYGNWSYNLFSREKDDDQWASFQFTTLQGGQVSKQEIEQAKSDLDERTFKQEYEASFVNYAGQIYYNFDRKENVMDKYTPQTAEVHIGMDFNIDPMSAVISELKGNGIYIYDEIVIYSSNTDEMVEEIKNRFKDKHIYIYPDPASKQRKTSAGGVTDLAILKNAGFNLRVRNNHPLIRDRINSVNTKLKNANGTRTLFIANKCKTMLKSIERQIYKEGTTVPDKDNNYDHMNDALGYLVEYLYPVRRDFTPSKPKRWS